MVKNGERIQELKKEREEGNKEATKFFASANNKKLNHE